MECLCGLAGTAAVVGACIVTFVSLCHSLAGLCIAEFSRPPAWRLAIVCGILSVAIGIAVAILFQNSPIDGILSIGLSLVAILFGTLTVLAGVVRRPRSPADGNHA